MKTFYIIVGVGCAMALIAGLILRKPTNAKLPYEQLNSDVQEQILKSMISDHGVHYERELQEHLKGYEKVKSVDIVNVNFFVYQMPTKQIAIRGTFKFNNVQGVEVVKKYDVLAKINDDFIQFLKTKTYE
jgi:hypothetical protein